VGSFATVGGFGFVFTALQESMARSGVSGAARTAVPRFVFQAALANGQRWGRVSAGFAGGRALGQLARGADDSTCAMLGAACGGAAAAASLADLPSSVFTFCAFSYFIDRLSGNAAAGGRASGGGGARPPPKPRPVDGRTPGERLDAMLGYTPRTGA